MRTKEEIEQHIIKLDKLIQNRFKEMQECKEKGLAKNFTLYQVASNLHMIYESEKRLLRWVLNLEDNPY